MMCTPHISMRESHSTLISAISNSFHSIIAVRSVSVVLVSCSEAIMHKSSPIHGCEERMGTQACYYGSEVIINDMS